MKRRSCDELGICQGLSEPCVKGCESADPTDLQELNDLPPDPWDRILFLTITAIAFICTLVVLFGTAGFLYAMR